MFCREGYHCVAVAFDAHITMSLPRRVVAATSDDRTRQLRLELFERGASLGLAAQACQSVPSQPLGLRPSQPGLPTVMPCYRATLSLAPLLACRCRGGFRSWKFPLRARPGIVPRTSPHHCTVAQAGAAVFEAALEERRAASSSANPPVGHTVGNIVGTAVGDTVGPDRRKGPAKGSQVDREGECRCC